MKSNPLKLGRLSWGLIVMFIGLVLLLDNMAILAFHWSAVFRFWPVLLILFGINILLPKNIEGQILSIMATLVALAFFAFQGLKQPENSFWFDHFQRNSNRDRTERTERTEEKGQLSLLSRSYDASVNSAILNISGGAVEYKIAETTAKLIDVEAYSNFSSFSLSSTVRDGKSVLDFSQKGHKKIKLKKLSGNNSAQIRLNPEPIWDINLEMGAGAVDFNLKPFKVRNLTLEGGASSFIITLGMPAENVSKVAFEGGVSSLEIQLPKRAGCKIEVKSALSSLDFPGFIKQEDGTYITENYENADKRFEIELDNGLSSIEISRYE